MLPLQGVKVIEIGTVLFAPYAAQWLGDFGADVVKVEALSGDSTRMTGPAAEPGMSATFVGLNRNKRSIALNIRDERGLAILKRLVQDADIFIHNIRPQKLSRLGIDPETLCGLNPKLIYAGLHGFGQAGPYAGRPAYDDIIQGLSGSVDLIRRQTGTPRYFPTVIADKTTGIIAALSILAAYVAREKTGVGCFVEIPMFESMVAFNLVEHLYGWHVEPPLGAMGYGRALSHARGPFRTQDGYISVMPYTDKHWTSFFTRVGNPEFMSDARYSDLGNRTINIDALYDALSDVLLSNSTSYWLALCEEEEIPAAPIVALDELTSDDHLRRTKFFSQIDDDRIGEVRLPGVPVSFDGAKPPIRMPPRLGEHTQEVLSQNGFSAHEIASLIDAGIAHQHEEALGSTVL